MARTDETARAPMLRRFGSMKGYAIGATDGDLGTFEDFYFDAESWTVRYLIVDTGGWLSGRRVLISPRSVTGTDPSGQRFVTELTRAQVERSPAIDTARPVSRQHEAALLEHYGHPEYWSGPYRWGADAAPGVPSAALPKAAERYVAANRVVERRAPGDPHLHSAAEVTGYGIQATDGELGHVEDFLIDEESMAIRYLIVDPRNWWPGEHVLIGTDWFTDVSWERQTVTVEMTRDAVRNAPVWRPDASIDRAWETELYGHYGRPGYWERPPERWMVWPHAA